MWLGVAWLMITGCVREVERGPDLGACADTPEGAYTWGEVGIGTCLSGPADLAFVQQQDRTFLAITNVNPFLDFDTGSVLVLDWDSLIERVEADRPERLTFDEIDTVSLPLLDDDDGDGIGKNPYLGGIGVLPGGEQALVATRLSEDSFVRSGEDELLVLDLSELSSGGAPILTDELVLRDDPFPVVIDEALDRAYVGNLTDHSLSVLDITDSPPSIVDVAAGGPLGPADLFDLDDSGTLAELTSLVVTTPDVVPNELFTFTWVDGTTRLWAPTPNETEVLGLQRWTTGGFELTPSAFGVELVHPGGLSDPFAVNEAGGLSRMWYASGGSLFQAVYDDVYVEDFWLVFADSPVVPGGTSCGALLGGPSLAVREERQTLFFDTRDAEGAFASIGQATTLDGTAWDCVSQPVLTEEGASLEDPFVVFDPLANRYRMWVGRFADGRWTIALTESDDPELWDEPLEVVLDLPGAQVAAPSVQISNGRYTLWLSVLEDGTDRWVHARSESSDGRTWTEPELLFDSEAPFDPAAPPRLGLQFDEIGAWRIEGADLGPVESLLPAGLTNPTVIQGFAASVANGHEVSNEVVPDNRAAGGLRPTSAVEIGGRTLVYATATGAAGRRRVVVLEDIDGELVLAEAAGVLDDALLDDAPAGSQATHPVVIPDADGLVMFYGILEPSGVTRLHRALSTDDSGLAFAADGAVLPEDDGAFDALTALPHSIEPLEDGSVRLWYSGDNADRFRIGSATAPDLRGSFTREPGQRDEFQLSTGLPGSFDDSGVKDPLVYTADGFTQMLYAGFDGVAWHLGHAVRDGDTWVRRVDPVTEVSLPAMSGRSRTFSARGVQSPVLLADDGIRLELLYAGTDGQALRVGRAGASLGSMVHVDARGRPLPTGVVYPDQRVPTAGDVLELETTRRGDGPDSVIELAQTVETFAVDGTGMTDVILDEARGFVYVISKANPIVYVVDVRDDSTGSFTDRNHLDLEGILSFVNAGGVRSVGYRGIALSRSRGLLYMTQRNPDGLVVADATVLVDDAEKEVVFDAQRAVLPLPDLGSDEGVETVAVIGGAGVALTDDEELLLATHFRGNSLHVFDLTLGPWGEEIAYLPFLGENPHVVRISPDGRWAVVANYLGDVDDQQTSSTLVLVDLDPDSDTYLEAVTWLANR